MLSRRLVVLASVTLISLVAIGLIADYSSRVMAQAEDSVDRTREVLLEVEQLRGAFAATESSARGYVITGQPSFRSDFRLAAKSMERSRARLKTLATNDAREQEQASLAALDALIVSRLELFGPEVTPEGGQATLPETHERVAKGMMVSREIGQVLDHIRAEELVRFRRQVSRVEAVRRFAIYGPWGMCLIAVIVLALMMVHVAATMARNQEIRIDLQSAVRDEHTARQAAEEADKLKDQFLATVSHELRTPLTSIIGWCGLLSDEELKHRLLDEGLVSIAQAARVQSQLVEDLLDVSRIIAGRLDPRLAEVNPVEIIENAIASVAPSARAKGITISRFVEGQPRTLLADAIRLEQVAWNLLSNAIKFTPENGMIGVLLRWTDSHLEIIVTDNGEGIGPDLLPHIFDRFRQGHATGTRMGGLGLGLSIVKSLVELHGGTVRAESAGAGAGATFTAVLPLARGNRSEVRGSLAHQSRQPRDSRATRRWSRTGEENRPGLV